MAEIIFHHYWTSPFAEKVRLVFGIKGLSWHSVEQPSIMPKPHLTALTGGYRRIPVMQIGADIYCDTQIILEELERRFPEPALTPRSGVTPGLGFWADRIFFGASVPLIFGSLGDKVDPAFVKDREALSGRPFDPAGMKAIVPLMRAQWRAHATFIEDQLALSGDHLGAAPSLDDVHAYLNIWFLTAFAPAEGERLLAALPRVRAWAGRMKAIGHGAPTPMTPDAALEVARTTPSLTDEARDVHDPDGLAPGMAVTVAADDYGRDPVAGIIVASSARRIAIRRSDAKAGDVVVHFPRAGYVVSRQA